MHRQARLDAPGTLHHVGARGIERTQIFRDDTDRAKFVEAVRRAVDAARPPVARVVYKAARRGTLHAAAWQKLLAETSKAT